MSEDNNEKEKRFSWDLRIAFKGDYDSVFVEFNDYNTAYNEYKRVLRNVEAEVNVLEILGDKGQEATVFLKNRKGEDIDVLSVSLSKWEAFSIGK